MKDQTTLNYEKRIEANKKRQEQLSADLKSIVQDGKKLERDLRTHRLCTIGGMVESYLEDPDLLDPDDLKRILDGFFSDERTKQALKKLLQGKATGESAQKPFGDQHNEIVNGK